MQHHWKRYISMLCWLWTWASKSRQLLSHFPHTIWGDVLTRSKPFEHCQVNRIPLSYCYFPLNRCMAKRRDRDRDIRETEIKWSTIAHFSNDKSLNKNWVNPCKNHFKSHLKQLLYFYLNALLTPTTYMYLGSITLYPFFFATLWKDLGSFVICFSSFPIWKRNALLLLS